MTGSAALPPAAAWRHHDARDGFETAFFTSVPDGIVAYGSTSAVEGGHPWTVDYRLVLDHEWRTRRAEIGNRTTDGERRTVLEHDGAGSWLVDGHDAPGLAGCLDVDLEASALTNAFPVRRAGLAPGERAELPAAYVRALDLGVDRLAQTYVRIDDRPHYRYTAPVFDFTCELSYDADGLLRAYPGIATRVH